MGAAAPLPQRLVAAGARRVAGALVLLFDVPVGRLHGLTRDDVLDEDGEMSVRVGKVPPGPSIPTPWVVFWPNTESPHTPLATPPWSTRLANYPRPCWRRFSG